jgi:hypothetical protein
MTEANDALRIRLTEAARSGVEKYKAEYINSLREVLSLPARSMKQLAEVTASGLEDITTATKVSLLYNEASVLDIKEPDGQQSITWFADKGLENFVGSGEITVTVPHHQSELVKNAIESNSIGFGFWMPSGEKIDQFLNDLAPLISQGRLIPRPLRMVFVGTENRTPEGGRQWQALDAAPGSQPDSWHLHAEQRGLGQPTATEHALRSTDSDALTSARLAGDIVLPYLRGVSLADYAKILDDENDLLTEFRAAMKQLAHEAQQSSSTLEEFRLDVVEPRISKINRAFERIDRMYRVRASGAAIATATLTLVTLATGGVAAAVAAAAGSAGLVATAKEVADRGEKLRSLKDDPLHLLWKLKKSP